MMTVIPETRRGLVNNIREINQCEAKSTKGAYT
jgi:hypothetical protein